MFYNRAKFKNKICSRICAFQWFHIIASQPLSIQEMSSHNFVYFSIICMHFIKQKFRCKIKPILSYNSSRFTFCLFSLVTCISCHNTQWYVHKFVKCQLSIQFVLNLGFDCFITAKSANVHRICSRTVTDLHSDCFDVYVCKEEYKYKMN